MKFENPGAEISRLRAALARIASINPLHKNCETAVSMARVALGKGSQALTEAAPLIVQAQNTLENRVLHLKPYFQDSHVTIYHGDNRELLPQIVAEHGKFDLLLTDPPYGIAKWSPGGGNLSAEECAKINQWDDSTPKPETLAALIAAARYSIIWGGNYVAGGVLDGRSVMGSCRMPLVWDKKIRGMHFADGEFAWTNFDYGTLRILELPASKNDARGKRIHPTQKPVALMAWCVGLVKGKCDTILDAYAGGCGTGVAAKQLGKRAVLIEREEQYCEAGAKRMGQDFLPISIAPVENLEPAQAEASLFSDKKAAA